MTEIVAAHLERVADVTDKLANAAAFYTMEYMAAKERGEHMPHGLDSVLKPIVAAALAACAREAGQQVELWQNAYYQDEGITAAGELRPLVSKLVLRAEKAERILKAATAALKEMEDYERHLQLQVFSTKEALRVALGERAVGEKGNSRA